MHLEFRRSFWIWWLPSNFQHWQCIASDYRIKWDICNHEKLWMISLVPLLFESLRSACLVFLYPDSGSTDVAFSASLDHTAIWKWNRIKEARKQPKNQYNYINEKSLAISAPRNFFVTPQLQAISIRFSCFHINDHDFNRTFTPVTNSEGAILSIWWILMLNDWTMLNFIWIENHVWIFILQRFYSPENSAKSNGSIAKKLDKIMKL